MQTNNNYNLNFVISRYIILYITSNANYKEIQLYNVTLLYIYTGQGLIILITMINITIIIIIIIDYYSLR